MPEEKGKFDYHERVTHHGLPTSGARGKEIEPFANAVQSQTDAAARAERKCAPGG